MPNFQEFATTSASNRRYSEGCNGPKLCSQKETEVSRGISNVRIHIEREIGSIRMRFDIMCGPVVMSNLYNFFV